MLLISHSPSWKTWFLSQGSLPWLPRWRLGHLPLLTENEFISRPLQLVTVQILFPNWRWEPQGQNFLLLFLSLSIHHNGWYIIDIYIHVYWMIMLGGQLGFIEHPRNYVLKKLLPCDYQSFKTSHLWMPLKGTK